MGKGGKGSDLYAGQDTVVATGGFLLTVDGEVGDALEVADDAGEVVYVVTLAVRTLGEVSLVDATTVVAEGVGDVEGEIIAPLDGGDAEEMSILRLGEVLLKVAVEGASSGEMGDVPSAVEAELGNGVDVLVFDDVEVGVVAVARDKIAGLLVPSCVLDADVFSRNHFAVEKEFFGAILLVVAFDEREDIFDKLLIFRVVANGDTEAFCRFDDAVDTDGEVLALDVDVAGIEEREQSSLTHPVEVFVVG